jgi:hypothetical protein
MNDPVTDMLATAIVQFDLEASTGDEAVSKAKSMFDDAMEDSDLVGGGGIGPLKCLEARQDGPSSYLASAVALFRVLVRHSDDPMEIARERLEAEIEESPLFSSGAVCTVEDD